MVKVPLPHCGKFGIMAESPFDPIFLFSAVFWTTLLIRETLTDAGFSPFWVGRIDNEGFMVDMYTVTPYTEQAMKTCPSSSIPD